MTFAVDQLVWGLYIMYIMSSQIAIGFVLRRRGSLNRYPCRLDYVSEFPLRQFCTPSLS